LTAFVTVGGSLCIAEFLCAVWNWMKMPRALLKSHMTGVPGTLNSENPRTFFRNPNQVMVKKGIARHKSQWERDFAYDISECKFPNIPKGLETPIISS
jgi:hypothetical protein